MTALIFDDSPIEKTSYKTELVSRVHDHVRGRFIFGYKLLVCGYWNGSCFIPIDFSLHRERGSELDKARKRRNTAKKRLKKAREKYEQEKTNVADYQRELQRLQELAQDTPSQKRTQLQECKSKQIAARKNVRKKLRKAVTAKEKALEKAEAHVTIQEKKTPLYGLTNWQRRKQFRGRDRSETSPGYQRTQEVDMKKGAVVKQMISRAIKKGFIPDYILFDSWFMSYELLKYIKSFYRKSLHVLE